MLINNQVPPGGHRHNYVRLAFIVGALVLFIGYVVVDQHEDRGNTHVWVNGTNRTLNRTQMPNPNFWMSDIKPSPWVRRALSAINYLWQFSWLLYSLTFLFRRSTAGYLYLSPNTLTPTFYIIYVVSFLIQSIWILFFQRNNLVWTWVIYLISFLLLSLALFIINNNLAINKKLYETEGFNRDVWFLRFFAQNGVAFFACHTAVRFIIAFDGFLRVRVGLSFANAGTIALVLAGLIALIFFFGPNFNAALVEKCAYQFAPWIVFILFFWGVVENNWAPKNVRRNNIIAAVELAGSLLSAVVALALFTIRYRASKIDPIA